MFLQNSINILFKYHGLNESTDMWYIHRVKQVRDLYASKFYP